MFSISAGDALSIVARVAIIYVSLLVLLRIVGRRTLSDVTPMDMLVMLLISETVSPSLTNGNDSIPGGVLAAGTLIALASLTSRLAFRHRGFERLTSGATALLIRDGKVDSATMRRFRITDEDLDTALHENGVLRVDQVARGFVEACGDITIVKKQDLADA